MEVTKATYFMQLKYNPDFNKRESALWINYRPSLQHSIFEWTLQWDDYVHYSVGFSKFGWVYDVIACPSLICIFQKLEYLRNVQRQISEHIFAPDGSYCKCLLSFKSFLQHEVLKIGEYSRFSPVLPEKYSARWHV